MSDARACRRGVWLVLLLVVVGACKREKASADPADAAAPGGAASAADAAAVDALIDHERALADNAEKLRGLGIELDAVDRRKSEPERDAQDEADPAVRQPPKQKPSDETAPVATRVRAATRCEELCGLAGTACELRGQICELAEDHVGESRYEDACWRATDQCDRASTACDDCRT